MEWSMSRISHEHDTFLDQITDAICRRGLRLPALIALDAGQPLAFLGGQLLWMIQPALSIFFPTPAIRNLAHLLEEPAALAALAARLEAGEA
jgi:hypothetical protein